MRNFTSRSVKPDLKPQNEDFLFETETAQGHFFTVLDFGEHDFANLHPTLEAKLETIVESFVTLSTFSADLFLGFLAREINNFLYTLSQQVDGPKLTCSGALCLVGDRLSYFIAGDTSVVLFNQDRTFVLGDPTSEGESLLGQHEEINPLTDMVQEFSLKNDDIILIMTSGLSNAFQHQELVERISMSALLAPPEICDSLMEASENSQDDRTLIVIAGPYEQPVATASPDLSNAIHALQEQVDELTNSRSQTFVEVDNSRLEKINNRLEELSAIVENKADAADVLQLQSEVSHLAVQRPEILPDVTRSDVESAAHPMFAANVGDPSRRWFKPLMFGVFVLITGTACGYFGGWLQSGRTKKAAEVWSVKTSGNQVLLSRLNADAPASSVLIPTGDPVKATGEQTFSSFADAKRYIDTVVPSKPLVPVEPPVIVQSPVVTESQPKAVTRSIAKEKKRAEPSEASIAFRQGDSLQELARRYNVAPAKLIALNPTITRWSLLKPGQKIAVPAGSRDNRSVKERTAQSSLKDPSGRKATVAAGETLDKLASRLKLTPTRLKQLNPQITNWSKLQNGQRVLVSNSSRG